jgi:hypothetical protein
MLDRPISPDVKARPQWTFDSPPFGATLSAKRSTRCE